MYTLYIGNRNYSSWSLRGWLATKLSGAPFREVPVQLVGRGPNPANRTFSPSGLVPCLHDGDVVVWDTLAIAEYLAERHAGLWPADAKARAHARCTAAEMHSGFGALRSDMSMCIRERVDVRPWSGALAADIERIQALWTEARSRFGGAGAFLYGAFSLADCFYAPVVFRFQTYGVALDGAAGAYAAAMRAHPLLREWETAALAETEVIEADEPRVIYRDKLARRGA
ncbi:MAG TPA: glutathione S-transferase family protein [Casimicrobiaceae bacterium]|nr:glutathione S-transferase family protein [Casimicrobiaceae bacterium]